jgi:hypothetical protein
MSTAMAVAGHAAILAAAAGVETLALIQGSWPSAATDPSWSNRAACSSPQTRGWHLGRALSCQVHGILALSCQAWIMSAPRRLTAAVLLLVAASALGVPACEYDSTRPRDRVNPSIALDLTRPVSPAA